MDNAAIAFEPRDPAFRADPYPVYDELRRRDPVHYRAAHNDWVLTRYHDVVSVLKDARFGYTRETVGDEGIAQHTDRMVRLRYQTWKLLGLWLVLRNPPDHTRLRKFMQGIFSFHDLTWLRARAEELTNAALDRALPQGRMDIMHDLAAPLPFTITCDMLGIPQEERAPLKKLAVEITYVFDLDMPPVAAERSMLALMRLTHCFQGLTARWRRQAPARDNLICALMRAQAEGILSEEEMLAQCNLTFFAVQVNVHYGIGNAMLALLRHPDQCRALRAQPALLDTAIDELFRYDAPSHVATRDALDDVEIGGKTIRKGQRLRLLAGAANRDPAVFVEPDRLNLARRPNPHLSLGYGIHYCLGASLGKLMVQTAIGTLLRRVPNLGLQSETLEWVDTFNNHGLKSLPVVFG